MGAPDPAALEAILPRPESDGVTPEMAGPRAKGRFRLAGPATYSYFEARRERYGWLRDPSGDVVITTSVLSGQEEAGPRHWFILLRHTREGWRVDKPIETSSLEDARIMAAMEWAGRVGYLVDGRDVEGLEVTPHDKIATSDGAYDIDATVRFRAMGVDFLVLVEAKYHNNPIKREVVQILYQKMLSAGAPKGIVVSTAPFQQGALDFAEAHGIALVQATEGRFTFLRKAADLPAATQEEARAFGIPDIVGLELSAGDAPGSVEVRTRYFNPDEDGVGRLLGVPGTLAG